jgi:prenyltransferase beta subunit
LLPVVFNAQDVPFAQVLGEALAYLQQCQTPDGAIPDASIVEHPTANLLKNWDTVNALKAIALWRHLAPYADGGTVERALKFLRSCEKPSGMISWGTLEVSPAEFCTETSSEYISALTHLGMTDEARRKALYLRTRQLTSGPWCEVHPHVPKAFQTAPSVTGFALMALLELDIEPLYLDEALDFLARQQTGEGHFGINWFYYNNHYYLARPVTAALAGFGYYTAVPMVRDFVRDQQRPDGSWFTAVKGFTDSSSPELQSALALRTLVAAGVGADDSSVRRGVTWLLGRRRNDGSWSGGPFPYPDTAGYRDFHALQDVFATSQVLMLLNQLMGEESP